MWSQRRRGRGGLGDWGLGLGGEEIVDMGVVRRFGIREEKSWAVAYSEWVGWLGVVKTGGCFLRGLPRRSLSPSR